MTISKENINKIKIDFGDEWTLEDDGTASAMFTGLEECAEGFFGINMKKDYPDGYTDCYAIFNPATERVTRLLFIINTFDDNNDRPELCISILGEEQELIYNHLHAQGGEEFDNFISWCREQLEENAQTERTA